MTDNGQEDDLIYRIKRQFSNAASTYQHHAVLQGQAGQELMSRLSLLATSPKTILDLGCASGHFSRLLQKTYPQANVIAMDLSEAMLRQIKGSWLRSKPNTVAGDMHHLPLRPASIDLVFSNQVLHWTNELPMVCRAIAQVLSPQGVLVFSTLGPDTFTELRQAWRSVDKRAHTIDFKDMHDVADILVQSGFCEPVVDMDYVTVRYLNVRQLCRDLKLQGVQMIHRAAGMTTPRQWQRFTEYYQCQQDESGRLPLTYELIYGVAWRARPTNPNGEVTIPLSSLKRHKQS